MDETDPKMEEGTTRIQRMREVWSTLNNWWLRAAILVEVLGLVAAFGSIPEIPLSAAWMLSLTGILSASGVVIVTVHFVIQYNRRRLNDIQIDQVLDMLAPYIRSEDAHSNFAPKSEFSQLVEEFGLFWTWRYQKSVVEFVWASRELEGRPGYVLVADVEGYLTDTPKVRFCLVPPPTRDLGQPLGTIGEELPRKYSEWGKIFDDLYAERVLYRGADGKTRYLKVDRSFEKVFFDDRTVSPIKVSGPNNSTLPLLMRKDEYTWEWVTPGEGAS